MREVDDDGDGDIYDDNNDDDEGRPVKDITNVVVLIMLSQREGQLLWLFIREQLD